MNKRITAKKLISFIFITAILLSVVSLIISAQEDKILPSLRQRMAVTNEPIPITVVWADPPKVVTYENRETYLNDRTIIELKMQGENLFDIWDHLHGVIELEVYAHSEDEIEEYLNRPEVRESIGKWADKLCVMDTYLPYLRGKIEQYKDRFTTIDKYDYSHYLPDARQCGTATPEQIRTLAEFNDVFQIYYGIIDIMIADEEPPLVTTNLMGDVDGDGDITANDARLVLRIAAKLDPGAPANEGNANVVVDGEITAEDAVVILRKSAKLPIYTQNCPYKIYI